jgi:copper chaperone
MTCGGCVRSVTSVLRSVAGVGSAEVSLERGEARVTYDPAKANVAQIKEAIEDAGYQAR